MNPVCQDQISTRPAETDFTLRLLREIEFHPGKLGQFSTWFLLKFEFFFFLISLWKDISLGKLIDSEAGTRGVFSTKS